VGRGRVFVLLPVTALLLGGGFRSSSPPLAPGGKIGAMTLIRGIEQSADAELWMEPSGAGPLGDTSVFVPVTIPAAFRA
jgi:hypothetical protein